MDGVIMNGTRIVILWSLQEEYLKCLQTVYFAVSKCRARAKPTVYWPKIDKDITNLIGHCDTCRQVHMHHLHMMNIVWKHVTPAKYLVQTLEM